MTQTQILPRLSRTTAGLRDALFDELDQLRAGGGNIAQAIAVCKIAGQIINVARAELDFHTRMNKDTELCDDFMTGKMNLGAPAAAASAPEHATGR